MHEEWVHAGCQSCIASHLQTLSVMHGMHERGFLLDTVAGDKLKSRQTIPRSVAAEAQ